MHLQMQNLNRKISPILAEAFVVQFLPEFLLRILKIGDIAKTEKVVVNF